MTDLIAYIAHPPEVLAWSNAQHARLVACVERHDASTAVRIMTEHLRGTEHVLAGLLPPDLTSVACVRTIRALRGRRIIPFRRRAGHEQRGRARPQQSDRRRARLAELGYKQDLQRAWSGFSNFAISFTIISVLAGCFTTYGQAWNNGGPIAISWGWPIICGLILLVAFSMSELVSAYPTAGGIYYWASDARRHRVGLVHRLVQPRRARRRGRVGRLRVPRSS